MYGVYHYPGRNESHKYDHCIYNIQWYDVIHSPADLIRRKTGAEI